MTRADLDVSSPMNWIFASIGWSACLVLSSVPTWLCRAWGLMEDCRVFGVYSFSSSLCQQADNNSPPAQLKLKDQPEGLRGRRGYINNFQLHGWGQGWRERGRAQWVVSELDNVEGNIRDNETTIFHTEGGCAPLTSALREILPFWRQQELFRQGLQPGRRATGWFFFSQAVSAEKHLPLDLPCSYPSKALHRAEFPMPSRVMPLSPAAGGVRRSDGDITSTLSV